MSLGEKIEELLLLNTKIWHEATKVKDVNGKLRKDSKMTIEERVECALKIRNLNNMRSSTRWEIDNSFGTGANESKVFSGE